MVPLPVTIAVLAIVWLVWWWALRVHLSNAVNLAIIVGAVVLLFPVVWIGRRILDRRPTLRHALWTTTFVQAGFGLTVGVSLIRALVTHREWSDASLTLPPALALALVVVTGTAALVTVLNLALKGLGAPFFIALSQRLAADWLYRRTRNPMVLAALAFFLSLGIWFQSALFVLWVLIFVMPALLFFVKFFEEKELEIRFGPTYLDYKARTPMLLPRLHRS
ncbi:MAG: methyltransferase family protein [Acidobacteriota bacterium]